MRYAASILLLALLGAPALAADRDPLDIAIPNKPMTIDAFLGTVNGEPIFVKDLIRPLDGELKRLADQARSLSAFKDETQLAVEKQLRTVIGDILVYTAAQNALSDDDHKKIDAYMLRQRQELLTKHRGMQSAADQALRTKGSSFERELAEKKRQTVIQLYMHKRLYPQITVTRRDIEREYERDITRYTQDAEVDLYTITIPVSRFLKQKNAEGRMVAIPDPNAEQIKAAETQAKAQAAEVYKKLQAGEDFATLAADYSADPKRDQGGRWAHTKKGSLARPAIEELAFSLKANTLAEPLFVPDKDPRQAWVVLVKVGEVKQAQIIPFEEAQKDIDKRLRDRQYSELSAKYMDELYKRAAIDRREQIRDMILTATEVAVARYATR